MNILIIDDEPLTVKSLQENMPWRKLGIEEVYTAVEPRFARNLVSALPVHIILCDIEMPGETGIDFLRWMKENTDCDAVTILLTAYDEFSYAKEAISLGVMDYLLKPIAFDELGMIIKKAAALYQKRQHQKKQMQEGELWNQNKATVVRSFWQDFFAGNTYNPAIVENTALGFSDQSDYYLILLEVRGEANALSEKDIAILLNTHLREWMPSLQMDFSLFSPESDHIYIIAYRNSETAQQVHISEKGSMKEILFHYLQDQIRSLQINHVNLVGCMGDACSFSELQDKKQSYLRFLERINDPSGMFLVDTSGSVSVSVNQAEIGKMFQEITNYIRRHLADDISRQDVADVVHMNADYLSKLIKKQMGITLSEYIRNERLSYASHLLLNSDMSINEIAILLNFSSQSHFATAFKKQYGHSPAEHRNSR